MHLEPMGISFLFLILAFFVGFLGILSILALVATKVLTGVRLQGVGGANPLRLAALNTWFELPIVEGLFDDGSVAPVTNLTPIFTVPVGTESFLVIDSRKRILARAIIPDATPALVGLSFVERPALTAKFAVVSEDAAPTIALDLPRTIEVGSELRIKAAADDDVGVTEVAFLLDDAVLGARI